MLALTRKLKGTLAMARIVRDANRLDEVFNLLDALADEDGLKTLADRFARSPTGRKALAERPRLGPLDLDRLGRYPEGTLARAFADHMATNQLDPAAIPSLPSNTELEWVVAHLYETHDLWHVLTGFDTDVAGELGLQAFYAAQVGSPLPYAILSAGMLNTALYARGDGDRRLNAIVTGWSMGRAAQDLLGVPWNQRWDVPLSDLRRLHRLQAF